MAQEQRSEVASFHLAHFPAQHAPASFGRLWADQPALRRVKGLLWRKPFLTGIGPPKRPHHHPLFSLRRTALLARWENEIALNEFLASSAVVERWRQHSYELWHVRLVPLASRGGWQRAEPPFRAEDSGGLHEGPAALVTYGRLRAGAVVPFFRALPAVYRDLRGRANLIAYLGCSEAARPLVTVSTFSLWTSGDDAVDFAFGGGVHTRTADRSTVEQWFRQTSFSLFRPYGSEGTWNGIDPLRVGGMRHPGPPPRRHDRGAAGISGS